jgi:hypothetical protein
MEHFNAGKKAQVSESMNYSILNGLILSHGSLRDERGQVGNEIGEIDGICFCFCIGDLNIF